MKLGRTIRAWAQSGGGLFWPSDKSLRVRPEYSIAESRVKQGRYAEAIVEYRKAAVQFPEETTPHMRLAELLLHRQHDPEGAIAELEAALPKAHGDDIYAAVRHRLADLYVAHRDDRAAARELMRQIQQQFPNSRQARTAAERLERLRDSV